MRTGSARRRRSTCTSAGCARNSATSPNDPRYLQTVRGVGSASRPTGSRRRKGAARLRTRLMLAMAYVLVLAIVALEVPLAMSLSARSTTRCARRPSGRPIWSRHGRGPPPGAPQGTGRRRSHRRGSGARPRARRRRDRERGGRQRRDAAPARACRRPEVAGALGGRTAQVHEEEPDPPPRAARHGGADRRRRAPRGAVRVTQDVADEAARLPARWRRTRADRLAVLGVGLVAGAIIARQIARPLRRLERRGAP